MHSPPLSPELSARGVGRSSGQPLAVVPESAVCVIDSEDAALTNNSSSLVKPGSKNTSTSSGSFVQCADPAGGSKGSNSERRLFAHREDDPGSSAEARTRGHAGASSPGLSARGTPRSEGTRNAALSKATNDSDRAASAQLSGQFSDQVLLFHS